VQTLPLRLFKAWVNLLCLARESDGFLPPLKDIAYELHFSVGDVTKIIQDLENAGLLDKIEDTWEPHDWQVWQFESDTSAVRMRRHRAKSCDGPRDGHVTANVTPSEVQSTENRRTERVSAAASTYGPVVVPERRTAPPPPLRSGSKPNGNAVRLSYRPEAKAAAVHMLTSWTEGRLGTADGQIAEALLLTIGGDSEEHLESLASWFRSLTKRGKEPGGIQGWGWFPRVLAEDLKGNATEAVNV